MNFDFQSGRITMVISPVDMRAGYDRLSLLAAALFDIDVDAGKDFVVFISKRKKIVKMIWSDDRGSSMLTRRLHLGRFERFVAQSQQQQRQFSYDDLLAFLDGEPVGRSAD